MQEHIESILLAAFFFPSAAAVLIFAMKYGSAVAQARVRLGQDEAYREIAAKGRGESSRGSGGASIIWHGARGDPIPA